MPRKDRLTEYEEADPNKQKAPKSRFDRIAEEKIRRNAKKEEMTVKEIDMVKVTVGICLLLLLASGLAGINGLLNPATHQLTSAESLGDPMIVNHLLELLTQEELDAINAALFEFYDRYDIREVDLDIIKSGYVGTDFASMAFSFPDELQLDLDLIRASTGGDSADYLKQLVLSSLPGTLQSPNLPGFPDDSEFYISEGRMLNYKGFGVIVQTRDATPYVAYIDKAFKDAFAAEVDGRNVDFSGNVQGVDLVRRLLSHKGISMRRAFDLNKVHDLPSLISDLTGSEIDGVHINFFMQLFRRANQQESAESLFNEYLERYSSEQ